MLKIGPSDFAMDFAAAGKTWADFAREGAGKTSDLSRDFDVKLKTVGAAVYSTGRSIN